MDFVFLMRDTRVIACSILLANLYSWTVVPENASYLRGKVSAIKSLD